jgi:hyperosmotically inducible protein
MRISATLLVSMVVIASLGQAASAAPPNLDNSRANLGDQSKYAVTAQNQDNKKSDIKILAKIRRHIMSTKGISMDAKNIKILVSKGEVTLKGPVKSEGEKTKLGEIAKSCCPEAAIVSQITVITK